MNNVLLFFVVTSFLLAGSIVEAWTCGVVPIHQWGSPSRHRDNLRTPVGLVVVTHTVTGSCDTEAECVRIATAIRNTQTQNGLNDIGLSFLVGGDGKIYEGAGWRVGSHTHGYDDRSISLSFIGDFRNVLPSQRALEAAENFLGCFLNTRYLDCEYSVVGHRQLINTVSPGDALQRYIQSWPHWTHNTSGLAKNTEEETYKQNP